MAQKEWWVDTPIYAVYVPSFMDTFGYGTGTIDGVTKHLDYINWLGIKAVLISAFYHGSMYDIGYDIIDYYSIDPIFGTHQHFKNLLAEVHRRGMYLIIDFVPNHTSDKHPWFLGSRQGDKVYKDYYIWKDRKGSTRGTRLPNNWESVYGGSAWTWCNQRKQYYYHTFLKEQPDLNFRNEKVRFEMDQILLYWLKIGVDGFRIAHASYMIKHSSFLDNPKIEQCEALNNAVKRSLISKGCSVVPIYNVDQLEMFPIIQRWCQLVKEYGRKNDKKILILVDNASNNLDSMIRYYHAGATLVTNYSLTYWDKETTVEELKFWIMNWQMAKPVKARSSWMTGSQDHSRIGTRLGGVHYVHITNPLLLMLPGTPIIYYGEELGLSDSKIRISNPNIQTKTSKKQYSMFTSNPQRGPMPWRYVRKTAGFTTSSYGPWLPVDPYYASLNVERQSAHPESYLQRFRKLMHLRNHSLFTSTNNIRFIQCQNSDVLAFTRHYENQPTYLIILYISLSKETNSSTTVDMTEAGEGEYTAYYAYDSRIVLPDYESINLKEISLINPHLKIICIDQSSVSLESDGEGSTGSDDSSA